MSESEGGKAKELAHGGLSLFTQALALYLGITWLVPGGGELSETELFTGWMMVAIDGVALIAVVYILRQTKR